MRSRVCGVSGTCNDMMSLVRNNSFQSNRTRQRISGLPRIVVLNTHAEPGRRLRDRPSDPTVPLVSPAYPLSCAEDRPVGRMN